MTNEFLLHAQAIYAGTATISQCVPLVWNALCDYAYTVENEWLTVLTRDQAVLFVLFVGHAEGY